jgi:transcriptional regulator with XRE-family HTH domain
VIRTEAEYRRTTQIVAASAARLERERKRLAKQGLSRDEIAARLDLAQGTLYELRAEAQAYERLKRGEFGGADDFEHLGEALVGLRIAAGLSQRALARKLGVHESQVSRDERYAYQGATFERLKRVLAALGFDVRLSFAPLAPPAARRPARRAQRSATL